MVEAAVSATETALEHQRIGGLQIRVAAICALVAMLEVLDSSSGSSPLPLTKRHC
jgi:hypothetical protein